MDTDTSSANGEPAAKDACPLSADKAMPPLITQSGWRKTGAAAVFAAGFLAWSGMDSPFVRQSVWHQLLFWGICLGLLGIALYTVVLDIRYIRLQYAIARRAAFEQTLGSEDFRKELIAGQRKGSGNNGGRRAGRGEADRGGETL